MWQANNENDNNEPMPILKMNEDEEWIMTETEPIVIQYCGRPNIIINDQYCNDQYDNDWRLLVMKKTQWQWNSIEAQWYY